MGSLFWKRVSKDPAKTSSESSTQQQQQPETQPECVHASTAARPEQVKAVEIKNNNENAIDNNNSNNNGAMEIPRPTDVAVFEFGSADMFTLAGFCPVSNSIQPCRWQIIPTDDPDAPQFRIAF